MRQTLKYMVFTLCFVAQTAYSQYSIPLEQDYTRALDNYSISTGTANFTSVKPFNYSIWTTDSAAIDSVLRFNINKPKNNPGWLLRKWRYENFLMVDTGLFRIALDPVFNLQFANDRKSGKNYTINTRGIRLYGSIDNKLFFESSFYENQANFPTYLNDYILSSRVVPGQASSGYGAIDTSGNFKGALRTFKPGSIDFGYATGSILLRFNKHWEFSLGNGKFFIGDGYRSLLLSDNAFNMPFLKATATYGKFQYTRIMAILLSDTLPKIQNTAKEKRLAGFNILSYSPTQWFHALLFEGTVWQYPNEKEGIKMDYSYYNPVILVNSVINGTRCNSIVGGNVNFNLFKTIQIYGQVAFDKLENTEVAYQAGFKYFNVFGIPRLYFQGEYNYSPKNFGYSSIKALNYSQLNQPLAHPIGNNFREFVTKLNYNIHCWQFNFQVNKALYGNNDALLTKSKSNYIHDYVYSTPFIGNGPYTNLTYASFSSAYLLNPTSNRKIEAGFIYRNALIDGAAKQMNFFYVAFKTSLSNLYYDF
jgi:hypothetical protein